MMIAATSTSTPSYQTAAKSICDLQSELMKNLEIAKRVTALLLRVGTQPNVTAGQLWLLYAHSKQESRQAAVLVDQLQQDGALLDWILLAEDVQSTWSALATETLTLMSERVNALGAS